MALIGHRAMSAIAPLSELRVGADGRDIGAGLASPRVVNRFWPRGGGTTTAGVNEALIALTTLLDRGVATGVVAQRRLDGRAATSPARLHRKKAQQVAFDGSLHSGNTFWKN
jgi:hypothetical protein